MSGPNTLSRSTRGVDVTANEINKFDGDGSDGTMIYWQDTQLTAAQVKALETTNITVVDAPASGLAAVPVAVHFFLDHGGSNDFVQTNGADALALKYSESNEIGEVASEALMTALIEASADAALYCNVETDFAPEAATAIVLDNNGAAAYSGNAANDNTISVRVFYRVVPMAAFS